MAPLKVDDAFGLDEAALKKIDWNLALKRVVHDLRSDFIYAPHLAYIYRRAGEELRDEVTSDLKAGRYVPGMPITIEVPKAFRIRVKARTRRLGPSYTRPGSILLPYDRLLYQALADQAAPIVGSRTDAARSFSHRLAASDSDSMFVSTRHCWNELQKALNAYANLRTIRYVLKLDVANFFGSLNQHTLVNVLNDSGYPKALSSRLESLLLRYTGERSSRGILQGMYPSDLLGNYYLAPIDRYLKEFGVPSARYVDDIYIFLSSVGQADELLRELIPKLRSYDLVLNEAKSAVMPKAALATEEPDLEELFSRAVKEVSEQTSDEEFYGDYGFQSEWEDEAEPSEELELEATKALFDSLSEFTGSEENIERFCLPLFSKAESDYAVNHVMESFRNRPGMSQIYASYLAKFLGVGEIDEFLGKAAADGALFDWQRMWALAALSQGQDPGDDLVKIALDVVEDANRHEALRAVALIFVGRFGDHARRRTLVEMYRSASEYLKAAIYYSAREWPTAENKTARSSWSGHGRLNNLLAIGMSKK